MKNRYLMLAFWSMLMAACNNTSKQNPSITTAEVADTVKLLSISALDARLADTDSVAILFYKDPHGTDSLRYTRYYTQYNSNNSNVIKTLLANLNDATVKLEKMKPCRSEGKMWIFKKGQIFQTIYFSSKDANCSFLYIIKDGFFYYSAMPYSFAVALKSWQKNAQNIPNQGAL